MKILASALIGMTLSTVALADHSEPPINPGHGGWGSSSLEDNLVQLENAAEQEAYEARAQRDLVLTQKYERMALIAQRMLNALDQLMTGRASEEAAIADLRLKTHNLEDLGASIRRLPYAISDLIVDIRQGVDEISEGGIIENPWEEPHRPPHGRARFLATCDVTMYNGSSFTLSVQGEGATQHQAIEDARLTGRNQCRANRARCEFGQCSVVRIR
jgi:hypothetical protein